MAAAPHGRARQKKYDSKNSFFLGRVCVTAGVSILSVVGVQVERVGARQLVRSRGLGRRIRPPSPTVFLLSSCPSPGSLAFLYTKFLHFSVHLTHHYGAIQRVHNFVLEIDDLRLVVSILTGPKLLKMIYT